MNCSDNLKDLRFLLLSKDNWDVVELPILTDLKETLIYVWIICIPQI